MIILTKNNVEKKVATGYSFKSLFFGVLYPIARNDFKGLIIQLILCSLTFGLSWFVTPFVYNYYFIRRLVIKGWEPSTTEDRLYLIKKRVIKP
jgi:hypothetical protein